MEKQKNLNGDAERVTVKEQGVEINDNISAPSEEMYTRHHKFHEWIDRLAEVQMCRIYLDSYDGI